MKEKWETLDWENTEYPTIEGVVKTRHVETGEINYMTLPVEEYYNVVLGRIVTVEEDEKEDKVEILFKYTAIREES